MDVFSGVCLFVSLSVCQHDNFRTIKCNTMKHETWRLGALYKKLARFRMSRSNVKVTGSKNEKVRHFVLESSSGVRSYSAAFLSGAVLGGAATPVGKSAHAV